jgi:hypothetical protein
VSRQSYKSLPTDGLFGRQAVCDLGSKDRRLAPLSSRLDTEVIWN